MLAGVNKRNPESPNGNDNTSLRERSNELLRRSNVYNRSDHRSNGTSGDVGVVPSQHLTTSTSSKVLFSNVAVSCTSACGRSLLLADRGIDNGFQVAGRAVVCWFGESGAVRGKMARWGKITCDNQSISGILICIRCLVQSRTECRFPSARSCPRRL